MAERLGTSQAHYWRAESGRQRPSTEMLERIRAEFSVDADAILREGIQPVRLHRISAGNGIEAIRDSEEIPVPAMLGKVDYALRVDGDSMSGDGIVDGDIVFIKRNPQPRKGSIAVVHRLSTNDATLKRFAQKGDKLELRPSNPKVKPFEWPLDDVKFDGVLVGVLRVVREP